MSSPPKVYRYGIVGTGRIAADFLGALKSVESTWEGSGALNDFLYLPISLFILNPFPQSLPHFLNYPQFQLKPFFHITDVILSYF